MGIFADNNLSEGISYNAWQEAEDAQKSDFKRLQNRFALGLPKRSPAQI